jgi:putative DNA methylase
MASAAKQLLPDDTCNLLYTDPPYYNAVPYADLSDFFYVWLKRTVGSSYPSLFTGNLSQKDEECCEMSGWDPVRYPHKTGKWFEKEMAAALVESRRVLDPDGVGIVVFAHKSTQGWEAQLQAIISAGWTVTGSWPIDTERPGRLRAQNSAALASSIHLVCRPRKSHGGPPLADDIGDWRDVLEELPQRLHEWMPRLASEGVVGADAIFACLGPALEIFSRYRRVEKASGEEVMLREYLEQVWAAVAREAISVIFKEADASGLEPDARLTAMWLWTLTGGAFSSEGDSPGEEDDSADGEDTPKSAATGGAFSLDSDTARKIAQGLGANLGVLRHVVEVKGETARLLPVAERARYLLGKDAGQTPKGKREKVGAKQLTLFEVMTQIDEGTPWGSELSVPPPGATVLDRVHQAMILFGGGRGEALKRFLVEDGAGNDARLWKLAQSLSALYPPGTDEKRWVDGVLARKKGLGF